MMEVICSSGRRFGTVTMKKTKMAAQARMSREDFIRKCPAYGLTPDFYQAPCLDPYTGNIYSLEGLSGYYCELSGHGRSIEPLHDFGSTLKMMSAEIDQELDDLKEKAIILADGDGRCARRLFAKMSGDLQARKSCLETAEKYGNPEMEDVFAKMGVPWYPGVKRDGEIYEFVSYVPEEGYVLENLSCDRYDPNRYSVVSFETLKRGLEEYIDEVAPGEETECWLQMMENLAPADASDESETTLGNVEADPGFISKGGSAQLFFF